MRNLVQAEFESQRNWRRLHKVLLGSVSAVAVGTLIGPALAQDNSSQPVETVVVTGIRASLQSAQSIKQNSNQIVDAITAVDIGALPDRNVADALQRVPGVTLQRTDQNRDPVRYGGTGNGVYIRGLAWVESLVNGRDEFSASNGRSLSFADVSADLLSGVNVYKNPDAKMIEGGIGGTVDLKTRKPFDQDGELMALSGDYTYADLSQKGTPSINALYSNRWNTHIGEIGALISADYQKQENYTNGISLSHFDCVSSAGGVPTSTYGSTACTAIPAANRRYIPNYFDWRQIDWQQQRLAFDGSVQWRPSDKWEFTAEGFYSKADPHDTEYSLPFNVIQDPTSAQTHYTYDANGVWTGGTITNAQTGGIDTRIGQHHDSNADFSLNAKFDPSENWTFSADVQYVESRATNYSMTGYSDLGNPNDGQTPGVPGEVLTMNVGGSAIASGSVSDPAAMKQAANYYYAAAMDHLENNFAHSWAYRADGTYTFDDEGGWLKSVDFGFRGENKQAVTRQTGYNWSILSHQSWGGGPPVFLTGTGFDAAHQNAGLPSQVGLHNFGSFLGGTAPSAWFLNASLLNQGTAHAYSYLKDTESNGWGWVPYASQQASCAGQVDYKCEAIYTGFTPEGDNVSAGVNNQREDTYAGYLMVNFAHSSFLGINDPIDGNIGVRVVQTQDQTSAGKMVLPTFTTICPSASAPAGTSCTDFNTALAFSQTGTTTITNPAPPPTTITVPIYGGTVPLAPASNTYTDILPSMNVRVHLTDELQARFAFSQSVVRPDFSYTQNYDTLGFGFGQSGTSAEGTFDPVTTGRTGTGGNPNVKPMHANNYDVSLEWYFAPTGSLTFALFHKDISDYFMTGAVPVALTHNGITETFQVTTTVNGGKGKVEGFELGYQQFFDSLPGIWGGFGFSGNYTKIYNSGGVNPTVNLFETVEIGNAQAPLPMEGMSPDSYNLQLLYEKFGISGRLAYNWRSRFLLTSSAANVNQPVWSENYGQLDGSIFYTFMTHYKIGIEATNLLHSTTILDVGYANFHPRYDWIDEDRKISLVFRANW